MTAPNAPGQLLATRQRGAAATNRETLDLLRRLADMPAMDVPILSGYFDLRPPADQAAPHLRETRVLARDRLREILSEQRAHGLVHDSLAADADRIEEQIETHAGGPERGLAVFACHASGLFETLLGWTSLGQRLDTG